MVIYLKAYVQRTKLLKGKEISPFVSWKRPHTGVSKDTFRRWTKACLEKVGIDLGIFSPLSTLAASTRKQPLM